MDLFVVVGLVYKDKESAWHVDGGLFGNSEDGSGDKDVPHSGPGRDTAEPALAAGFGDDGVGPGHLETAEGDACEDGDEGAGKRVTGDVGADEADDAAVEKVVDYGDVEAAETGEGASLGAEVLDGGAHFGGDGLLLDEEEVRFDNLGLFGFLVLGEEGSVDFVGVGELGFESCGGRSLDHGESCYDITVGVGDLMVGSQPCC